MWCGVVWCGVVWCGVVWCGVVWCGGVGCGVVWWGGPAEGQETGTHENYPPRSSNPPLKRGSPQLPTIDKIRSGGGPCKLVLTVSVRNVILPSACTLFCCCCRCR